MRTALFAAWMLLALGTPSLAQSIPGDLTGALSAGGQVLHLVLHVKGSPGNLTATLDSTDQHACGIAVDSISMTGSTLTFAISSLAASFSGTQNAGGFQGTFSQNGTNLPLTLSPGTIPCAKASTSGGSP